jgi:hypothetical protein
MQPVPAGAEGHRKPDARAVPLRPHGRDRRSDEKQEHAGDDGKDAGLTDCCFAIGVRRQALAIGQSQAAPRTPLESPCML